MTEPEAFAWETKLKTVFPHTGYHNWLTALHTLRKAIDDGDVTPEQILEGADRYAQCDDVRRGIVMTIQRWASERKWSETWPAKTNGSTNGHREVSESEKAWLAEREAQAARMDRCRAAQDVPTIIQILAEHQEAIGDSENRAKLDDLPEKLAKYSIHELRSMLMGTLKAIPHRGFMQRSDKDRGYEH